MTIERLSIRALLPLMSNFEIQGARFCGTQHFRTGLAEDGLQINSLQRPDLPTTISLPDGATLTKSRDSVSVRRIHPDQNEYEIAQGVFSIFIRTRERATYSISGFNLNRKSSHPGQEVNFTRRK